MPVTSPPFSRHVLQRTVVLPELRIVFLPIPKAGSTSVLWLLAELAGLPAERFERSATPEVSPALTVHDMALWEPEHRLAEHSEDERERILLEDGWLRFCVVRHPAPRLWSAWQSKLLLREPAFAGAFAGAPWYPRVPERAADLIEDFRRFVAALPGGTADDVHWAVQHDLASQLPLTHVGRVEQLPDTLALLRAHVPDRPWPGRLRQENRTAVPMPADAFDEASAAVLAEHFAADFRAYGYGAPAPAQAADRWEERVEPLIPLLRAGIDAHARVGQLHALVQRRTERARAAERRVAEAAGRTVGHSRSPVIPSLEGHPEYDARWGWAEGEVEPGLTAVLRVRDEAASLPWVLPALLGAVRRVVLVDNGSTDGTAAVARRIATSLGAAGRLEVREYPFAVARCGAEHLATPAASVHSLTHFYNWSFAHVRTAYALKWDGDMVLTDAGAAALRDLAWQLEAADAVIKVPRHPVYVVDERCAYLDTALRNREPWGWPNRPGYSFAKAMEWELPLWGTDAPALSLPDWTCVELKHLGAEEFAHWSDTDFTKARTGRKQREWQVFNALRAGGRAPDGVIRIDAPEGRHVIEHLRSSVLPALAAGRTSPPDRCSGSRTPRRARGASAGTPPGGGAPRADRFRAAA